MGGRGRGRHLAVTDFLWPSDLIRSSIMTHGYD